LNSTDSTNFSDVMGWIANNRLALAIGLGSGFLLICIIIPGIYFIFLLKKSEKNKQEVKDLK